MRTFSNVGTGAQLPPVETTIVKRSELGDNWSAEHHIEKARAEKAWAKKRERLEASISDQLWGRAREQGWINKKGKLSARGHKAALEFIIGIAAGINALGQKSQAAKWILWQALLCSIRGVEERFPQPTPKKEKARG